MPRAPEFTRENPVGRAPRLSEQPTDQTEDNLLDERAVGTSYERQPDWRRVGLFGAGLAIGLAVGAGAALLLAPQSGEETRELLGAGARRLGGRAADRWDELRDELRWLARRGRKSVRRGVTRGRWAAEDAIERRWRRY
jgi:hypothetical protein